MKQIEFANKAKGVFESDENVLGLAVGGSWLDNQLDEYSDLDLVVVTREKITHDKEKMLAYAKQLDGFISGFTGEHVGEPRVLICLYDKPLLHVDIKFLTLEELSPRVETPKILFDREGQLQSVFDNTTAAFPHPEYQWIEDRFWTWIHYALLKIGRGEYLEALDFQAYLRMVVFGPLLHIKNGNLPRGVRKVETDLEEKDFNDLLQTVPTYDKQSLLEGLKHSVLLYRKLRSELFDDSILLQLQAEEAVMVYFNEIEKG